MPKKPNKASIERTRAAKARAAWLAFKKRSLASKKGWERKWRVSSESLLSEATSALRRFRSSHSPEDYAKFRKVKQHLYRAFPDQAEDMVSQAAELAEWTASVAMKFAKLS